MEGAAGLVGCCMARLSGFQVFSCECSASGVEDLKKLKLNMMEMKESEALKRG